MIVLIGNYRLDGQESMLRFHQMMLAGLRQAGDDVRSCSPEPWLGKRLQTTGSGWRKWCGYFDKFIIYPYHLRAQLRQWRRITQDLVVHICDHSNGMYAPIVRKMKLPVVVTCHDLGAVRGAMGEDTDCPASLTGKFLQSWIRHGLGWANAIACDSTATRGDVLRLIRSPLGATPSASTILLGQNAPYQHISDDICQQRLSVHPALKNKTPFLLHVGSSGARKNREGVLNIFALSKDRWSGDLVFAGEPLSEAQRDLVRTLGLTGRVWEVVKPPHDVLEALYNQAFALLFPSKFEGFGWPVIEAQACGCPVLCSDAGSLAEVAGESAFIAPWSAEAAFADEIIHLKTDPPARRHWIALGLQNMMRFRKERMIAEYRDLYETVYADKL